MRSPCAGAALDPRYGKLLIKLFSLSLSLSHTLSLSFSLSLPLSLSLSLSRSLRLCIRHWRGGGSVPRLRRGTWPRSFAWASAGTMGVGLLWLRTYYFTFFLLTLLSLLTSFYFTFVTYELYLGTTVGVLYDGWSTFIAYWLLCLTFIAYLLLYFTFIAYSLLYFTFVAYLGTTVLEEAGATPPPSGALGFRL